MDRKSFIYFADGTLRAGTSDESHDATNEEWTEAATALLPNARRYGPPRHHFWRLFLPPEER